MCGCDSRSDVRRPKMWSEDVFDRLCARIDALSNEAVELQKRLVRFRAVGPVSGGPGEFEKASFLRDYLREHGFEEIEWIEAPDERVPSGVRPSLIVRVPGESERTVWVMAHTDIVPEGPRELWESDPFELTVSGDRMTARGVEDNNQAIVAAVLALRALKEEAVRPPLSIGLLLVADEETGSDYGVKYVLRERAPFGEDDLIVVPDGGLPDGSMIEVAEKSILWLKLRVVGKQGHGSRPDAAKNAARAAAYLTVALDEALHAAFAQENPLFSPPVSTFEPTKRKANVENVNTIPGEEVFHFDCRVLPEVPLSEVEAKAREVAGSIAARFGVEVEVSHVMRQEAAPPTPADAPVVTALREAVKRVYGVEAKPMGIGGGTVAAFLRGAGLAAAVWSRIDETAHQPNEYSLLSNTLGDAKVLLRLFGAD